MKSKTGVILLILIFVFTALAALASGNVGVKGEDVAEKEDVVDIFQIEEELGVKIDFPATMKEKATSIYNGHMGVIEFDYEEETYSYIIKKGEKEENLSGLALENPKRVTVLTDKGCYYVEYGKENEGYTYWLNEESGLACTVRAEGKGDNAKLKDVTEKIIEVQ